MPSNSSASSSSLNSASSRWVPTAPHCTAYAVRLQESLIVPAGPSLWSSVVLSCLAYHSIGGTTPPAGKTLLLLAGQPVGSEFNWRLPTAVSLTAHTSTVAAKNTSFAVMCCAGGAPVCVDGGSEGGAAGPHGWIAAPPAGQQEGEGAQLGCVQSVTLQNKNHHQRLG